MREIIDLAKNLKYDRVFSTTNSLMLTTKMIGGVGELQQAIINYDSDTKCENCCYSSHKCLHSRETKANDDCKHLTEIRDAIGGIVITLVMLSFQEEVIDLDHINFNRVDSNYNSFEESCSILEYVLFIQYKFLNEDYKKINYYARGMIDSLNSIVDNYYLTLIECVEYSYNEVKDKNDKWV